MLIKLEVLEPLPQSVSLCTLRALHLLQHMSESPLIVLVFLLHFLHPGLVVLNVVAHNTTSDDLLFNIKR
jgi:hypothetical protein